MGPYRILEGAEEQAVIDGIKAKLPTIARAGDITRWERGWSENLEAYKASGNEADLRPKYIRQGLPLRLWGRFIEPEDTDYEWNWYQAMREKIGDDYLAGHRMIWEFGCGSGHNLAWLKRKFPEAQVVGLDWSWSSVELARRIGVDARRFDFFNPVIPNLGEHAAVLTIGALEQTGNRWKAFMMEMLQARPGICVHLEPMREWYDRDNIVDASAIAVHAAKGFWTGFWEWLKAKRREHKVEILEARRTGFGSLMVEGYNVIVWRPI